MASARLLARQLLAAAPAPESPAGTAVLAAEGTKKPLVSLQPSHPAARTAELGVDTSAMDLTVRPQNDFFDYVNGTWIKNFKIPADKAGYGVFDDLYDKSQTQIRAIIEEAAAGKSGSADDKRIAALYQSFMHEKSVEARGAKPLAAELARIDAVKTKRGLTGLFAWAGRRDIGTPVNVSVGQDSKDPSTYIVSLDQSGLGLPDRDYYFNDDARSAHIRAKYVEYITKLLTLAGEKDAARKAADAYAVEKALAEKQWTQVEMRDAVKTYNKVEISGLAKLAPGFDWAGLLRQAKVRRQETHVLVSEPSYLTGFAGILKSQSLDAWKSYMKVRALSGAANYLSKDFVDAVFDYRGKVLNGTPEMRPRWKRGVQLVDGSLGESIGRVYVQKHFPESSKKRMLELVENLRAAYAQRIQAVTWMSDATKAKALEKLRKFTPKIGYPDKWIDYSKLRVKPDDLLGNVRRVGAFEYRRMMAKLGQPVDRGEWGMTPQDINAYYNPVMNEIVFPAGILQAPFFNPAADDAVNYGAIGGIIGHEMSHGFDDQGAEYDGDGRLENWWTEADKKAFQARTAMLVKQFNSYEPIKGQHVNGELTLGENIADLGGLTIALQAYKLSLSGKEAPVINGFTGEQRVFLGWAQAWRGVYRDEAMSQQMSTDPHSPNITRVNGVMRNMPEFYKAFGLKPGDELYLPEQDRVGIW
ncbi:MAG: M13 family metallopeptidase [Elusimicrobia bacterium]|nr:M13 family metallopeptidase [Elusimicrobiota bacterium]